MPQDNTNDDIACDNNDKCSDGIVAPTVSVRSKRFQQVANSKIMSIPEFIKVRNHYIHCNVLQYTYTCINVNVSLTKSFKVLENVYNIPISRQCWQHVFKSLYIGRRYLFRSLITPPSPVQGIDNAETSKRLEFFQKCYLAHNVT